MKKAIFLVISILAVQAAYTVERAYPTFLQSVQVNVGQSEVVLVAPTTADINSIESSIAQKAPYLIVVQPSAFSPQITVDTVRLAKSHNAQIYALDAQITSDAQAYMEKNKIALEGFIFSYKSDQQQQLVDDLVKFAQNQQKLRNHQISYYFKSWPNKLFLPNMRLEVIDQPTAQDEFPLKSTFLGLDGGCVPGIKAGDPYCMTSNLPAFSLPYQYTTGSGNNVTVHTGGFFGPLTFGGWQNLNENFDQLPPKKIPGPEVNPTYIAAACNPGLTFHNTITLWTAPQGATVPTNVLTIANKTAAGTTWLNINFDVLYSSSFGQKLLKAVQSNYKNIPMSQRSIRQLALHLQADGITGGISVSFSTVLNMIGTESGFPWKRVEISQDAIMKAQEETGQPALTFVKPEGDYTAIDAGCGSSSSKAAELYAAYKPKELRGIIRKK